MKKYSNIAMEEMRNTAMKDIIVEEYKNEGMQNLKNVQINEYINLAFKEYKNIEMKIYMNMAILKGRCRDEGVWECRNKSVQE